jgi:hypothetical protein
LTNHPRTDSPFVFPGRSGRQRVDINKQRGRRPPQGLPGAAWSETCLRFHACLKRPGGHLPAATALDAPVSEHDDEICAHARRSIKAGLRPGGRPAYSANHGGAKVMNLVPKD